MDNLLGFFLPFPKRLAIQCMWCSIQYTVEIKQLVEKLCGKGVEIFCKRVRWENWVKVVGEKILCKIVSKSVWDDEVKN